MARPRAPSTPPWLLSLEALTARLAYLFASELAAPVALDRLIPRVQRNPGPHGMGDSHQTSRSSVMAKKKKAKKKSKGY